MASRGLLYWFEIDMIYEILSNSLPLRFTNLFTQVEPSPSPLSCFILLVIVLDDYADHYWMWNGCTPLIVLDGDWLSLGLEGVYSSLFFDRVYYSMNFGLTIHPMTFGLLLFWTGINSWSTLKYNVLVVAYVDSLYC